MLEISMGCLMAYSRHEISMEDLVPGMRLL